MSVFVNVKDFGANGDGTTDDRAAIQAAIDNLPATGGTVYFPPGTYRIAETIVLGNATSSAASTRNGISLLGSGMGKDPVNLGGDGEGASRLLYDPSSVNYGDVIKFNGPVEGCRIENMVLDGNNKAGTLLNSQRSFHQYVGNVLGVRWRAASGTYRYALRVHASNQYSGGAGGAATQHLYENVLFANPTNDGGYESSVSMGRTWDAQGSPGNCNQLAFLRCMFWRANSNYAVGVQLGWCDHIDFIGCHFLRIGGTGSTGRAIAVNPETGHYGSPINVSFVGTALSGGIYCSSTWSNDNYPALIFYPYYTADGQPVPPAGADGITLPAGLVCGVTDNQQTLGYNYEQVAAVYLQPTDEEIPWSGVKSHTIVLHKDDYPDPDDEDNFKPIKNIGTPRSVGRAFSFELNIIAYTSRINGICFEEGSGSYLALINSDPVKHRVFLKNYRLTKFIYCSDTGYWHQAASL